VAFTVFQGTSNGGQRSSNRKTPVNGRSDLPDNGTIWRFDRLLLKNRRPPCEVPWKTAKALAWGLMHLFIDGYALYNLNSLHVSMGVVLHPLTRRPALIMREETVVGPQSHRFDG